MTPGAKTLEQIAEIENCSREQIRKLEARALRKIRIHLWGRRAEFFD